MIKNSKKISGVSIIEIIVVVFILASAFFGIVSSAILTFRSSENDESFIKANFLAQEGIEGVRSVRDNNYWLSSGGLGSLSSGVNYYLSTASSSRWALLTSPLDTYDIFTRTVKLSDVYRDSNDNIASSGSLDSNTKLVTVDVSWQQRGINYDVALKEYLTNWPK